MKATEAKLLSLLQKSPQFIIPIYQRTYSWTEKQCQQLWEDIIRAGSRDDIPIHFVGSIVYVEQGLSQVSHQAPLLVIDGQQRLTTVTLLIEALAQALGEDEPVEGFSAAKLRHYYLSNPLEKGDRYFKLLLSQTDDETLRAVIKSSELPRESSVRISENFSFFQELLAEDRERLPVVCRGLAKLVVVDIALNRDQDNPQLIFESMNSTGKELSQADLIRNYILMGLEPTLQTSLYEEYWRPMERDFGQESYGTQFDGFMRNYLTVRTGDIPREGDVYEVFKDYAHTTPVVAAGIEALVKDIRTFSRYFCAAALGAEKHPELASAFQDLRELKVDVSYPFILELYEDYDRKVLPIDDFVSVVRLIESYVFRRAICSIPTNSMNKTFATFSKSIRKDRYLESIQAQFLGLPSYRRFPSDQEFKREIQTRDLYNLRSRAYWLRRFENFGRKERVLTSEYTIEHILPQNQNLSSTWRADLGPEWEQVQQRWLHTLGNLTLTGYNSEYSDRSFAEKRDMEGGFKDSPLKLNAGLGQLSVWNENTIKERALKLSEQAVAVWKSPNLEPAILALYAAPKVSSAGAYTINDHRFLSTADGKKYPARALFDILREKLLAIDPRAYEEFKKLYVAYKVETNFVDIVPQTKCLRLTLNMPFSEIKDPKGICRDVSGLGRWGNGDVEVYFELLDQLPDVMALVQQAYEYQMEDIDSA
jgi:uncharacterized protein with ParB-like and HNH nuclease domain/predicted transport protein